jgi:hypothetical protein
MNLDTYYALKRSLWYNNPVKLLVEQTGQLLWAMLLYPKNVLDFKRMATFSSRRWKKASTRYRPLDVKI